MDIPKSFKSKQGIEEKTNQLLEGPHIKQEEEDSLGVSYEDLSSRELRACNYREGAVSHIVLTFKHEMEDYEIAYFESGTPFLQVVKPMTGSFEEAEKQAFKRLARFIFKNYSTKKLRTSGPIYFVMTYELSDNIKLEEVAKQIDDFYKPNFSNVFVKTTRFAPVSSKEINNSNLPKSKIKDRQ